MVNARWQPFAEVNRLQHEMDRLFDSLGLKGDRRQSTESFPPLNVWESSDQYFVEAELPGFQLDDLEIYVAAGNQLSIKGERKQPEVEKAAWHRQERAYGSFDRTLELPDAVESDKVTAELSHGVLTIHLPKSEDVKPRRIEVKTR